MVRVTVAGDGYPVMNVSFAVWYVLDRPVTSAQLGVLNSNGVYDILQQQFVSSLCTGIIEDGSGSFPEDPSVSLEDGKCHYGKQVDPNNGDCTFGGDPANSRQRLCPCTLFGKEPSDLSNSTVTLYQI